MFHKYRIGNCSVVLRRLEEEITPEPTPKLSLKSGGTVRSNSNITWFPALSTIQKNSVDALSSLSIYQARNEVQARGVEKSEYIFTHLLRKIYKLGMKVTYLQLFL